MPERAAGSIYDLGYRRYEGRRLGRWESVWALYLHGLRASFGLGRRARSKIFPIGLVIVAAIPAVGQVLIATIADDLDVFRPEDYYSYIQIILVLFVAVVAPELLGRDKRHSILPLYFSRGLSRYDYALARYASMVTALLALTLLPQAIMFIGNALVGDSFGDYLQDEWRQIGPIIGSGLVTCLFLGAIGMIIAAQTPRRAFATVGILVPFVALTIVGNVLIETVDNFVGRLGIFLDLFSVMQGYTYWMFDVNWTPTGGVGDDDLGKAGFAGGVYLLFALAVAAASVGTLVQHYMRRSL